MVGRMVGSCRHRRPPARCWPAHAGRRRPRRHRTRGRRPPRCPCRGAGRQPLAASPIISAIQIPLRMMPVQAMPLPTRALATRPELTAAGGALGRARTDHVGPTSSQTRSQIGPGDICVTADLQVDLTSRTLLPLSLVPTSACSASRRRAKSAYITAATADTSTSAPGTPSPETSAALTNGGTFAEPSEGAAAS
jgi:hypothetical protein